MATGLSPNPAPLTELGGALGSSSFGGSLVLRYLLPTEAKTHGGLGLQIQSLGARLSAFYAPGGLVRCEAGVSAYRLRAEGTGVPYPTPDSVWLVAPEVELAVVGALSRSWSAELGLHGRVGVTRPRFEIRPETEVFRLPRLGAGAIFRVSWTRR